MLNDSASFAPIISNNSQLWDKGFKIKDKIRKKTIIFPYLSFFVVLSSFVLSIRVAVNKLLCDYGGSLSANANYKL